jgi:hypothetical protein
MQIYKHSHLERLVYLLALCFYCLAIFISSLSGFAYGTQGLMLFLLLWTIKSSYFIYSTVTIDESCISIQNLFGIVKVVAWTDIDHLKENRSKNILELFSSPSKRVLHVGGTITDYKGMLRAIEDKLSTNT